MSTFISNADRLLDEEAFRQSEASVRLEGIDPNSYPIYVTLKEKVLSGEISSEESLRLLSEHYRNRHHAAA